MDFKKIASEQPVVSYLTSVIGDALAEGKRVLWLLPGGSAIGIAVAVSKNLQGKDLHNLMVTLNDEHYGDVGHADSNWQQLVTAGLDLPGAQMVPVLIGASPDETVSEYADQLQQLLEQADYKLGFFGVGADGHTAGILPGSPALSSMEFAALYDGGGFTRITMSPLAIEQLDEAVVYAVGSNKQGAIENLKQDIPAAEQPAQLLKKVPKVTIFNDQIGADV